MWLPPGVAHLPTPGATLGAAETHSPIIESGDSPGPWGQVQHTGQQISVLSSALSVTSQAPQFPILPPQHMLEAQYSPLRLY